jgi:hypothetical protein
LIAVFLSRAAAKIFDFGLDSENCLAAAAAQPTRRRIIYDKIKFEMLIDGERREF